MRRRGTRRAALSAAAVALLCAAVQTRAAAAAPLVATAEAALLTWLASRGADLGAEIRPAAAGRPRGVFATRAHAAGDVVGYVPFAAAVPVGATGAWDNVASLARAAFSPGSPYALNRSFAPFWATQPRRDEMLCLQTMTPPLLAMLESKELQAVVEADAAQHAAQYAALQAALAAEAGTAAPPPSSLLCSFEQYMWLAALVTTRAFSFWSELYDASRGETSWLLPGLDLLNTRAACNAARHASGDGAPGSGARVEVRAGERGVAAGEELFWAYHIGHARIDVALLLYGMVNGSDTRLAAVDRAEWRKDDVFAETPDEDTPAEELSGAQAAGELARVRYILRSLAPAEQDAAALAAAEATPPADARVTELLRFRVARKAALRARADAMRGRLGPHGDEL